MAEVSDDVLISNVQGFPHLYDKRDMNFTNAVMKNNSWLQIALNLNADVEDTKKRWLYLRERFIRSHRNMVICPNSGAAVAGKGLMTTFRHYNAMMWLKPYIRQRRKTSSTLLQKDPLKIEEPQLLIPTNCEVVTPTSVGVLIPNEEENSERPFSPDSCCSSSYMSPQSQAYPMPNAGSSTQDICNALRSLNKLIGQKAAENCADVAFMKSIVEEMNALRPLQKLYFKKGVWDLLLNATQISD